MSLEVAVPAAPEVDDNILLTVTGNGQIT
jgi:hypothetical protein